MLRGIRPAAVWLSLYGWHVLLGWGSAFAEEILIHLFNDGFLVFPAGRIQAVLVEQHLAEFCPTLPCLLRDVFVYLLSKFRVKGWLIQPWKFFVQLDTEYRALSHISPQGLSEKLSHTGGKQRAQVAGSAFLIIELKPLYCMNTTRIRPSEV